MTKKPIDILDYALALHAAQCNFASAHMAALCADSQRADQIHSRMLDLRTVRELAKDGKLQEAYTFLAQLPNL